MIAVIGAGGKTTLVHRLAERYRGQGRTVLLTTTTHMAVEPDTDLSDDPVQIAQKIRNHGYCMAGVRSDREPEKFGALSEGTLRGVMDMVDVILIEADGAKHHNAKFPRTGEPVIRQETTEIILVMGLAALGHPAGEEIFRLEHLQEYQRTHGLPVTAPEDTVDLPLLELLVEEGYRKPLRRAFPEIPLRVCYTCRQDGELITVGENLS